VATGYASQAAALKERLASAQLEITANVQKLAEARSRLAETRGYVRTGRSEREILHDSAYARLVARLESLPVIEQAKGILMAESGCTPDEAFSMLRAASQRANVRVRDLASEIVDRVSSGQSLKGLQK
jgi:hypothetical protein